MNSFFVPGIPVQQGSMKAFNNRVVHNSPAKLKEWRKSVAFYAELSQVEFYQKQEPVYIQLVFNMPKPKSVKRDWPSVPPDLDKLIRSVLDALKGIAYADDGQVVQIHATKQYKNEPGVFISVSRP